MNDTYDSAADARLDRAQQRQLLRALGVSDLSLRRDECGAWRVNGSHGSIHTWGDGKTWVLYVRCESRRQWTATKKRLAFCRPTQDGDDEGCLRLYELPNAAQAIEIGIRKRTEYSQAYLETLASRLERSGSAG